MDISQALAPKSDQLDAVDLLGSPPMVFTITDVNKGSDEQPVNIHLAEFPRVWRPSKGMLRVLAHCWGKDVAAWVGRKVELYTDPDVMFGPVKVGGIRIQRLSHIGKRTSVPMIVGRGKSGSWNVDPLPDAAPTAPDLTPQELAEQLVAALADATTEAEVREWGNRAHARNLLDLQVGAETVKSHVQYRLAELVDDAAAIKGGE